MKKDVKIVMTFLSSLLLVLTLNLISAQLRINEVELNPQGSDSDNEWIELYSDQELNLSNYRLINEDNKVYNLSGIINGHLIIELNRQFLDNNNESLKLYNNQELIFSTPILKDSYNDNKSWSYCSDNSWIFFESTKNSANNCNLEQNNNTQNQNISENNTNTNPDQKAPLNFIIELDLDNFENGKIFKFKIKAFNLENKKYDVKAWIHKNEEDDKILSKTYNSNHEWESSNLYYEEFFLGPGNKTKELKIKINEDYVDYKGYSKLKVRIRETGKTSFIKEYTENIEVLDAKLKTTNSNKRITSSPEDLERKKVLEEIEKKVESEKSNYLSGNAILLTSSKLLKKTSAQNINSDNVIYESNENKIKKYALYSFTLLCVILLILLMFNKKYHD
jgi:hypothetical protein